MPPANPRREAVGDAFSLPAMVKARDLTFEAVRRIAAQIRPGVTEGRGDQIAQDVLEGMGMDRLWHRNVVRFGPGTVETFHGDFQPDYVLQPDDIFFVDLGAVFDGHEGDAGDTFVVGDDAEMHACATQGERSILAGQRQAQDLASGLGKIVRINPDGSTPKDNPFVGKAGAQPVIWSYGNRNVQAAALHPQTGELWEVEFGPQGGDELNVIRKGKDYGPAKTPITGGETQRPGMEQPLYYWDPVIAPSGMIFYTGGLFPKWKGSILISGKQPQGLPGGAVTRLTLKGEKVVGEERLDIPGAFNWRDIRQGPDGAVYLLKDGPAGQIIKLTPKR
jgi:glucose/arabinose dehydrogenase